MNISVTNLNQNLYEAKNLKKCFVHTGFCCDTKSDSVEISENNKNKKKLSKWQKVLIVGTAIAAAVALVLSKGKTKPIKMSKPQIKPATPTTIGPRPSVNPSTTVEVGIKPPVIPSTPITTGVKPPVVKPDIPSCPTNIAAAEVRHSFVPIKYKKAKTFEEAKFFAQTKLGINEFTAPDVETANQINYSLTKLYNKTQGLFHGFSNVKYERIADDVNPAIANTYTCARTTSYYRGNVYQSSDLIINQNWFENAEKSIEKRLKNFESSRQIKILADGVKKIELLTKYRYQDSLNRYYKLYQQGKLTPKAKVDFASMLYYAGQEENYILNSRKALVDFVKQVLNKDMSLLSQSDYRVEAQSALKAIRRKNGRPVGRTNFNHVNGFAGLDGTILHEGGHCLHNKKMHLESTLEDLKNRTMTETDKMIARKVSDYATTKYSEFLQEVFSGILCGDKYSQDVMDLYKKLGGVIPAGVR